MKAATTTKEVLQVLGFSSFRLYIKDFAEVAKPLAEVTKKGSHIKSGNILT